MSGASDGAAASVPSGAHDDRSGAPGDSAELEALITAIPEGWSRARIDGSTWGVTRNTHAGGMVMSLDAERLGSAEALGANVWFTSHGTLLRPCEIPAERVWRFLRDAARARATPAGAQ